MAQQAVPRTVEPVIHRLVGPMPHQAAPKMWAQPSYSTFSLAFGWWGPEEPSLPLLTLDKASILSSTSAYPITSFSE